LPEIARSMMRYGGVAGFHPQTCSAAPISRNILGDFDFGGPLDLFFLGIGVRLSVVVSLERILNGGEETVHIGRSVLCQARHGSGACAREALASGKSRHARNAQVAAQPSTHPGMRRQGGDLPRRNADRPHSDRREDPARVRPWHAS
jgi:hypothetical protein